VKLLFTLAEFSAHVSSKMKAQKKRIAGAGARVVVSGYLSLVLVRVDLVLLFKRNMLFLGSWFVRHYYIILYTHLFHIEHPALTVSLAR